MAADILATNASKNEMPRADTSSVRDAASRCAGHPITQSESGRENGRGRVRESESEREGGEKERNAGTC